MDESSITKPEMAESATETAPGQEPDRLRLGGMALENGLLVYGPTHWAAAVRDKRGEILVSSGKAPRVHSAIGNAPGVRGVARLAESMAVIPVVRAKLPQARLPFENPAVIAASALTTAIGILARHGKRRNSISRDLALSLIGLAPAIISLRSGNVAAYHGVEHKAIAAYEQGGDPTDASVVEAAAKEHERCGSHLVAPMMLASVTGEAVMRRALEKPGLIAQTSVALAGAAASVEMFAYAERHPDSTFARVFRKPGFELQRAVGTREPTPEQIEVGRAAIGRLLEVEGAAPR
ncbi:MAG: DUF1385 domain-containing protein [Actinobacteria bacterium]|nr:DUF1385 domain-containing protein [Actinomycetota bacterium]